MHLKLKLDTGWVIWARVTSRHALLKTSFPEGSNVSPGAVDRFDRFDRFNSFCCCCFIKLCTRTILEICIEIILIG